ncbi:MAG: aldo/keto reductase [Bacteroidales bacterium]|nr:aldo/keto reductase [Bacteroidales bacterium]
MSEADNTRREFLQTGLAATAAVGLAAHAGAAEGTSAGLPTRKLGKTGQNVSIICLGGWHIGAVETREESIRIMHAAIDEGLTFFDNAWDYHNGKSEEWMGHALTQGSKRDKVFLMSKVCARDGKGIRQQLEESLKRLRTDHIDLWQFHEINYDNDPSWIVEKGGLAEALQAQKEGKIRYLGFTGHKHPDIHRNMLAIHDWDTVQMPVNVCDTFYRSFIQNVIPEAKKRNIGVIGMKTLAGGRGKLVLDKVCTATEAHHYALTQDVASIVVGIDSMEILQKNLADARSFQPLSGDALTQLLEKVKPYATDGRHELFKSDITFDGPYHRKQHGFEVKAG